MIRQFNAPKKKEKKKKTRSWFNTSRPVWFVFMTFYKTTLRPIDLTDLWPMKNKRPYSSTSTRNGQVFLINRSPNDWNNVSDQTYETGWKKKTENQNAARQKERRVHRARVENKNYSKLKHSVAENRTLLREAKNVFVRWVIFNFFNQTSLVSIGNGRTASQTSRNAERLFVENNTRTNQSPPGTIINNSHYAGDGRPQKRERASYATRTIRSVRGQ